MHRSVVPSGHLGDDPELALAVSPIIKESDMTLNPAPHSARAPHLTLSTNHKVCDLYVGLYGQNSSQKKQGGRRPTEHDGVESIS